MEGQVGDWQGMSNVLRLARTRAGSPDQARLRGLRQAAQAAFWRVACPCTGQASVKKVTLLMPC